MKRSYSKIKRVFSVQLAIALLFLLPITWIVLAALNPPGTALLRSLPLETGTISFRSFDRVLDLVPIVKYALNSLLVVAIAVPLSMLISSWAGFGMARLPRASQRRWLFLSLAVLMIPGAALWSTRFLVFKQLGWLDSIWALIAPAWMGTSPFFVLMFYRGFRRIAAAIYDAARIDGAGVLRTWYLVALPVARPTVIAVALLSFIVYWGDFISPLLHLRSEARFTLPVALQLLQQQSRSDWPLLMAAEIITSLVPVLLFLLV